MAKRVWFDNYVVKASVPTIFGSRPTDHKMMLSAARTLEDEIKRHCDQEGTQVDFDNLSECEYCGSPWSEKSDIYNGGCCDKDEEGNSHET